MHALFPSIPSVPSMRCALLLATLLLNGCLLGPNYERPQVDVPTDFRFAEPQAKEIANTAWWQQFQDPALNDLIDTALKENKDIKVAAARVDQFLGQFQTTRSQLFPQIGAGANATRERVPTGSLTLPPGVGPVINQYQLALNATWEIDVFGRLRRETEAARANMLASEEGRRATILALVASVASTYIQLVSLDRQLAIAHQTVTSREESVKVFKLRFQYGEVSQMELAQAQSEYQAALATVPQLEQQIATQENAMAILLGRNPQAIARDRELDDLATPDVPAGLPSDLLERRPDLRQAEQDLIAANAKIGAARALYFPQISLTGLLGQQSSQFSQLFKGPARAWSFAGAVTQPIFTAGGISGQVKAAEAAQQQALFSYEKAIQSAFQDVDDSLVTMQKTREARDVQGRQVDAERSLFQAQLSYT
ncbi:RND efflux system, outer membrane lipoprotein CmeC [Candidatus Burkholderia verschuerenii]|uniref:RND efflux system, outer membrane lipoprotein CmeC n=1 Tax=Candidatus Burkholderia verschuerenii TaxID=242163 RepID=A0A0L0M9W3_9BURK|nr:RND efflux system, outer membrane lipoprotein CmeC [Candidatus Burkholderia verschuerenii]